MASRSSASASSRALVFADNVCTSAIARLLQQHINVRSRETACGHVLVADRFASCNRRKHDLHEKQVALAGSDERGPVDARSPRARVMRAGCLPVDAREKVAQLEPDSLDD